MLTIVTGELSFGLTVPGLWVVQFSLLEALVVLFVSYPETIWGLYLGCLAANLLGGFDRGMCLAAVLVTFSLSLT